VITAAHRPYLPSGAASLWGNNAVKVKANNNPIRQRQNAALARWARRKHKAPPPSLPKLPWETE